MFSFTRQPVGVGFSIGNHMPMNEEDVARDFYGFWLNFVKVFGLQKRRIYMFAESYGVSYNAQNSTQKCAIPLSVHAF